MLKKGNHNGNPPMVGVGFLWEDLPLGISMIRVRLIKHRLMTADTSKSTKAKKNEMPMRR